MRATTARALVALGRRDEARRVLHELEQEAARRYVRPEAIAEVYVALGEPDAAFRWLETAYRARSADVLTAQGGAALGSNSIRPPLRGSREEGWDTVMCDNGPRHRIIC